MKVPTVPEGIKWIVAKSSVLDNEIIVLVMKKKFYKEAKNKYPETVIYFPHEIVEVKRISHGLKDRDEFELFLRKIHLTKKILLGWLLPTGGLDG